ncbi:MAG: Bug family tripartite tricarboxylate transporter substrate binding protein [Burkholderiales bacterium]
MRIFAAVLMLAFTCSAGAQYPDRPVRIVVPFGAGGLADISFRIYADKLTVLLGKPVVVENLPGAGGIAAATAVLRAKPDGHTLLVITNGTAITKSLFKSLPFDPQKDFAPVSFAAYFDLVVLVKGDGRYRSLGDLLAAAKSQPGKLNFGTINPGSTQNLSAALFRSTAGIDVPVIPFKSSPEAMTALLAGELDAVFESYAATKALVDAGRARALASTGAKRSGYLPSVPTAEEAGLPGYEVSGWNALAVPTGTPAEVIAILNKQMNVVAAMPDVKKRLLDLGTDAYAGTPEEIRARFAADVIKWAAVIKQAGIQPQ